MKTIPSPSAPALIFVGFTLLALAYASALEAPFFWDDHLLIEQNPLVLQKDAWKKIFQTNFWELPHRSSSNTYYRPIVIASFIFDAQLWKLNPLGFHLTNLLLHFANSALVFALARRVGAPSYMALLAMLLFGAMPRLTESATWISGRTDLFAALGATLAIVLYRRNNAAWHWRFASALALLFGLLSKEVALAALLALIASEWVATKASEQNLRASMQAASLRLLPAVFVTALYFFLRFESGVGTAGPLFYLALGQRLLAALQALGTYGWMLLTPWSPHLSVGTLGIFDPWRIGLGIPLLAGIAIAGILILRRSISADHASWLTLCIAALLPVLHLIPIPIRPLAADRFLYLPVLGGCILLCVHWQKIPPLFQRIGAMALGLLVLAFLGGTQHRNREWRDEIQLWQITVGDAEAVTPKNGGPYCEFANVLTYRGRFHESLPYHERCYDLEKEFQTLYPDYPITSSVLSNWALTLSTLGVDLDRAVRLARQVAEAKPDDAVYRHHYAMVLARALEFEAADQQFATALSLYPNYDEAQMLRKQTQNAAGLWRKLPPETPNEAAAIRAQRGFVYFFVGRISEANQIWIQVVGAPDADAKLLQQAKSVLENQRRVFGETADTKALAEAIEKRRQIKKPMLEIP